MATNIKSQNGQDFLPHHTPSLQQKDKKISEEDVLTILGPSEAAECVLDSPQHQETGEEIYIFRCLYNAPISLDSSSDLKKLKLCEGCGKIVSYSFSNCPRCGMPLSSTTRALETGNDFLDEG